MSAAKLLLVNVVIELPDRDNDLQTQKFTYRKNLMLNIQIYGTLDALKIVLMLVYLLNHCPTNPILSAPIYLVPDLVVLMVIRYFLFLKHVNRAVVIREQCSAIHFPVRVSPNCFEGRQMPCPKLSDLRCAINPTLTDEVMWQKRHHRDDRVC